MEKPKPSEEILVSEINITSVRIHYIFSFAFSAIPLLDYKVEGRCLGDFIANKFKGDYLSIRLHQGEEEEPLNARSALYIKFPHLSIRTNHVDASFLGLGFGTLQSHTALFESGMGTMWLMLDLKEIADKGILFEMANREYIPKIIKKGSDDAKSPYEIFLDEIGNLKEKVNAVYETEWSHILWSDDKNSYGRGPLVFQEPTVTLILKSDNFREIKRDFADDYKKFITGVLHGININDIDITHCLRPDNKELDNLYHNEKFAVYFHSNCLLLIHNEDYGNGDGIIEKYSEYKKLTFGLFRTYCAIRGTWHLFTIINEQIDNTITDITNQFSDFMKQSNGLDLAELLQKIIAGKIKFLVVLDTEDPFVQGIGLTPFNEIYQECEKVYRLSELKQAIMYKLNELDRLFSMVHSYSLIRPVTFNRPKNKRYFNLLYFSVFLLLLSTVTLFKYDQLNIDHKLFWVVNITILSIGVSFLILFFIRLKTKFSK